MVLGCKCSISDETQRAGSLLPSLNSLNSLSSLGAVGSLDTLAQLRKVCEIGKKTNKSTLFKRARAKAITNLIVYRLAELNSPLRTQYNNSFHCSNILIQEGKTIQGKYCKNRWCLVCNRIRTANLMNGYMSVIEAIEDKYFVTLTIPNVKDFELSKTLREMIKEFRKITDTLRKKKIKIIGLRKLECTYNTRRNDFHPHFHLIVKGKNEAKEVLAQWLKRYSSANLAGQDIKRADNNSARELFKYFTKMIGFDEETNKREFNAKSLDIIFRAMRGMRVFQPIGMRKVKVISEEIEEIKTQTYPELSNIETAIWEWYEDATDWIDFSTGQCLTRHTLDEGIKKIFEVENSPP